MSLADILWAAGRRQALIGDCVRLIEDHVERRGGLKGMALRTGLALLKKAKPGILERATGALLPDFIAALEPMHTQFRDAGGGDFGRYLQTHAAQATAALLAVADARVAESDSTTVHNTYARMRSGAEDEVMAVMPALAALIGNHYA